MSKIITEFWQKPIPERNYDWEAIREDYNEGDPIGYGKTEKEAIIDLLKQEEDLLEKEYYTKPLQEGQLCVFFDDLSFFRVMFYFSRLGNTHSHIDHTGTGWNYAFPYEGQTLAEIQEKINSLLKDK